MIYIEEMKKMVLVDRDIQNLIATGILSNADEKQVGSISYDLRTEAFSQTDGATQTEITLAPGESTFVSCQEVIHMPQDMIGRIILRNSRIREGLSLDAPVYQPGHETRIFFRISNVTEKSLVFKAGAEFASIMFEQLDSAPEKPYSGTFQKELVFRGLGNYKMAYKPDLTELKEKADSLHNIERSIYGNVIMLVTAFIAIFSLINVNINLAYAQSVELTRMLVVNFSMVGSLMLLISVIRLTVGPGPEKGKGVYIALLVLGLLLLGAAMVIAL